MYHRHPSLYPSYPISHQHTHDHYHWGTITHESSEKFEIARIKVINIYERAVSMAVRTLKDLEAMKSKVKAKLDFELIQIDSEQKIADAWVKKYEDKLVEIDKIQAEIDKQQSGLFGLFSNVNALLQKKDILMKESENIYKDVARCLGSEKLSEENLYSEMARLQLHDYPRESRSINPNNCGRYFSGLVLKTRSEYNQFFNELKMIQTEVDTWNNELSMLDVVDQDKILLTEKQLSYLTSRCSEQGAIKTEEKLLAMVKELLEKSE